MPEESKERASQRKLSSIIINRTFQLRYVKYLVLFGFLLTAMNAFVFYVFVEENYQLLVELSPMTEGVKTELYNELRRISFLLALTSMVFVLIVAFWGLIVTHRIAGPLYRLKKSFSQISQSKDFSRKLQTRPNDDFKDVIDEFNLMLDTMK